MRKRPPRVEKRGLGSLVGRGRGGHISAVHWQFLFPIFKTEPWGPESGPLGQDKTWIFIERVSKMVPGPWAEVGDHFRHPQGVQVKAVEFRVPT